MNNIETDNSNKIKQKKRKVKREPIHRVCNQLLDK